MLQFSRVAALVLAVAGFALWTDPAAAGCQLVKVSASAGSKADAAKASHSLALDTANQVKAEKGWSHVSLSAYKVAGDPFWKMVRPDGVPQYAKLPPDIVTSKFFTTCFTGVVVPYVCTTGSKVCGN